jgi:UDP-GlcNAc3NAcA epimerase
MKICTIVGARPQLVKAAVVSRAVAAMPDVHEIIVHTGQHYDDNMSRVFFRELGIATEGYNLGVGSGSHGEQTARMLEGIERVLVTERPDVTLIYGDTNSTVAGALASAKLHVPVAHVEAGLRSFNRHMPEEINRLAADAISDVLFSPTKSATAQLLREGHPANRVVETGDVMFDAALAMAADARAESGILASLGLAEGGYYLATVHRAENTDDASRLSAIVTALEEVARQWPVVMPLHPRTRAALEREHLMGRLASAVTVCEPLGYRDMVRLEMSSRAIITDSGGVQKEAFFFGVPAFVLRNETEWTELIDAGWNVLVPPTTDGATMAAQMVDLARLPRLPVTPYGTGHAGQVIAAALAARFGQRA